MSDSPDAIRADIEQTRREFSQDVDALADKVSPAKMVERQTDKVKSAMGSVKDRFMGASDNTGSGASDPFADARGNVADAKDRVVAKAEGNPMAVGLIALGAGLLVASLIPASTKEKELASNVKDQAQPLVEKAKGAAKEMGENLKEPAQQAAASVKDSATDAADHVKADASAAKDDVTGQAQQARDNVAGS